MSINNYPHTPKSASYDVIIIGGATSGSSIAWFLSSNPDFNGRILVVERDPSLQFSATKASNNCIRQQFATSINVKIAQYGASFIKDFHKNLDNDPNVPNIPIRNFGYLYLADNQAFAKVLEEDRDLQASCGAGTRIVSRSEIAKKYPFYHLEDVVCGSLNTVDEGAFDALGMVEWLRQKATARGVEYVHSEVVAVGRAGDEIKTVTLKTGETIAVGRVVNASGTRAGQVASMAGVNLPIEARRRYTYIFEVDQPLDQDLPLTIDPTGVHLRSFGEKDYLVGCPPIGPDIAVDVDDFGYPEDVWNEKIFPVLAKRVPQFSTARITQSWVGHYEFNTFDHNAIIGPHTEVKNLLFCCGFSGHGSQQAPACGRALAELIVYGAFRTLDLSDLLYNRIPSGRPILERAVI
ncbi:putative fad oxidoreductase [Lasiodiplodia theobromae]|uniref:putative fad oxidoreductase n=1 Tax=Lasiodiplodia theobromae TaxID=45133 RepID=UPI0015C3BA6C|nr:putative fad oxidoreductase [Lasiodiplodia theobromae]KAF4545953.1 putative fad oxidoreductase [Lasiodiplodia theobromae]